MSGMTELEKKKEELKRLREIVEREKAEKERAERERAEGETAERERAERERAEREEAKREEAERERAEWESVEKEDDEMERELEYLKAEIEKEKLNSKPEPVSQVEALRRELAELKAKKATEKKEAEELEEIRRMVAEKKKILEEKKKRAEDRNNNNNNNNNINNYRFPNEPPPSYSSQIDAGEKSPASSSLILPESRPSTLSSSILSTSSEEAKLREKMEQERRKIAQLDAARAVLIAPTEVTSDQTLMRLDQEIVKLKSEQQKGKNVEELTSLAAQKKEQLERAMYGVDVCFIMDCTGSMQPWINVTKEKIVSLTQEVRNIPAKKTPSLRIAFVGYRDIGDNDKRLISHDFFDLNDATTLGNFRTYLAAVPATGGADGPEDVTGGMDKALSLKWASNTRVVIHFADAPCHGKKYHSMEDDYPDGCPNRLVPEVLLERFVARGIAYNFGEINKNSTSKMTDLFAAHMKSINQGDEKFKVLSLSAGPAQFLPVVINSISRSMEMSGLFMK